MDASSSAASSLADSSSHEHAKGRFDSLLYLLAMLVLAPITMYAVIAVKHYDGALVIPDARFLSHLAAPTWTLAGLYLAWLAFQVILAVVLPGKVALGVALEDGRRLPYKLNGLLALVVTFLVAGALVWAGWIPATIFADQIEGLVTTMNIVVYLGTIGLYLLGRSQANGEEKKRGAVDAFFMGAALNPRTGSLDWKFFCESRPGMILWLLFNASFAAAQAEKFGAVSTGMWLVLAFQLLYVVDYFVLEDAILTTWDIRHEPFGFMLCWGTLVWIPITFSLQGLYLSNHPVAFEGWQAALLIAFNLTGYVIFRVSNLQKHRFRDQPTRKIWGKPPEYIETQRGTKLLVSGFWGLARHTNYLGDLMMGLAWCLCTGASNVLPYFYIIYFVILLVHRERRDNDHCARKYGQDWQRYCERVPYRILPFVY